MQITRNEDCTYRVQVTRTTGNLVCPDERSTQTIFETEATSRCIAATALGSAPAATGGVVEIHESQMRPDGTYDNRATVKTELPVSSSSTTVSVGRRGTRTTVVDTNQENAAATTGVAVGGTVRVEKTPGGRYNNTVTTWDNSGSIKAGDYCTEDVFRHQHDVTSSGATMPPSDGQGSHVSGSGTGGKVVSRRTDMDEEGAVMQTTSTVQEKLAPTSEESWQVGLFGTTHTVKHRNVPNDQQHSQYYGTTPASSDVGSALHRVETPGGLYDVTLVEMDRHSDVTSGVGCSKTVFQHVDTNVVSADALPSSGSHVGDAGLVDLGGGNYRGCHFSRDARVNPDGTVTVTETKTEELPVTNAQVRSESNAFVRVVTRVDKNQYYAARDLAGFAGVNLDTTTHVITSKTFSMNPGGSYDITTETRTPRYRTWSHVTDTNWRWSKTVWFRNATRQQVDDLYKSLVGDFNAAAGGSRTWSSQTPTLVRNDGGTAAFAASYGDVQQGGN